MVDIVQYLVILIFIPIILTISYITKQLLLRNSLGPFGPFITGLRFIGVLIHELSHFLMCLIVGVRPDGIKVKLRSSYTRKADPHGEVSIDKNSLRKMTFLQAALISLAPVIFATWLFFWCLTLVFMQALDPMIRIAAGLLCVSLLLGGAPSVPDFRIIGRWFKKDPKYSLYQIFLVLMSGLIVWVVIWYYRIVLPLDIVFYILIGIFYFPIKYFFTGINKLIHSIHKKEYSNIDYKIYTQSRFKQVKPYKIK